MGLVNNKLVKRVPHGFKQAFSIARTYPADMPSIVVKTGKKGALHLKSTF
jgi:hypothetical protein